VEKLKSFLTDYHARTGEIPGRALLCHELKLTLAEVNACLRELVFDGTLKEFAGRLRLAKPGPVVKEKSSAQGFLDNLRKVSAGMSKLKPRGKLDTGVLVRWILFAVAVIAMIISTGYSYAWLVQFLDPVRAVLLAAAVVVYVTFAPEGAALLLRRRSVSTVVLASLLVMTALAALVFSMAMTVIGQYNGMTELLATRGAETSTAARDVATLDVLRAEERTAQAAADGLQREVGLQHDAMARLEAGTPAHGSATRQLGALQDRLYYAGKRLTAAREKVLSYLARPDAVTTDEVRREDFYTFAARETGMGRGVVEFILYLIPALFMDIIAPLGMFVALGVIGRREDSMRG